MSGPPLSDLNWASQQFSVLDTTSKPILTVEKTEAKRLKKFAQSHR